MTEYEYRELIEKAEKYDELVEGGVLNDPRYELILRIYYNHRDNAGKWDSVLACKTHHSTHIED